MKQHRISRFVLREKIKAQIHRFSRHSEMVRGVGERDSSLFSVYCPYKRIVFA